MRVESEAAGAEAPEDALAEGPRLADRKHEPTGGPPVGSWSLRELGNDVPIWTRRERAMRTATRSAEAIRMPRNARAIRVQYNTCNRKSKIQS